MTEFDETRLTQTHNPIVATMEKVVLQGIDILNAFNEKALASEAGTPDREVDKVLKEGNEDEESGKLFAKAQASYAKYRKELVEARNAYRTNVLGQTEVVTVSDEEKEAATVAKKTIQDAVKFVETIATGQDDQVALAWIKGLEIPGVGRKGTTSAAGVKRPHVEVFVDGGDTPVGTLGVAAKQIGTTQGELAAAWESAGADEFEFFHEGNTHKIRVVPKQKKSE